MSQTIAKWASSAGPRQTKAVVKALRDVEWAGKSMVSIVGPKSAPSRSIMTNLFGDIRPEAMDGLAKLHADFGGTITADNHKQIAERAGLLLRQLQENMPIDDRTTTPAEDAEREQARQADEIKRQAERDQHSAAAGDFTAELRARYPWAVPASDKISEHARAAKNLRRELSEAFPGVAFSVKPESYSGGNAVDVGWQMGPTTKEVTAISDKYQAGSFDGMTDCYDYDHRPEASAVRTVLGQAKYVQESRGFPSELYEQIGRDLCQLQHVEYAGQNTRGLYGAGDGEWLSTHIHRLLSDTSFKAGETYKGVRYMTREEQEQSHSNTITVVVKG